MPNRKVKSRTRTSKPQESQEMRLARLEKFRLEYDDLRAERARLREEITGLDSNVPRRGPSKKQHDQELRQKLAKAGMISRRIAEVIGEMAKLGKIPESSST
jgi:hypothetical protein